jgi:phosphotransferase system  glucose/maltose/N-acetylglucosamine-specific IIC component
MVFLGIDWGKIFSIPFWLEVNPGDLSDLFEKMFLIVLIICYVFYAAGKISEKKLIGRRNFILAKFCSKVANYLLTMAVSFTFIFFFRYEAIPYLGGRFWILIWVIMGLAWAVYLVRYFIVDIAKQQKDLDNKQRLRKYFVKK